MTEVHVYVCVNWMHVEPSLEMLRLTILKAHAVFSMTVLYDISLPDKSMQFCSDHQHSAVCIFLYGGTVKTIVWFML